ncbi:depolymerase [Rhodospirillum sp. A1_3_36]|uniref:extracellular catalytic domain type 2 short-chain-length polyhydroxyalkanoate depolymerase n=1 Tax=Rhodospirillum sp. A1_3_36 TaxID=3391666 RepID=UPI0039A53CC3
MRAIILSIPIFTGLLACTTHAQDLPHPGIAAGPITVSGISSGSFMANQFEVAHSALVEGAGLVAGGLYGCAVSEPMGHGVMATASRALDQCMGKTNLLEKPQRFIDLIKEAATQGDIDDPVNLKGDRVYLFSGREDHIVGTKTVETAAAVLDAFGAKTTLLTSLPSPQDKTMKAGHSFITLNVGNPCNTEKMPYINDCDYDQAGAILSTVLGEDLAPPAQTPTGTLSSFPQAPFIPGGKSPMEVSLWDKGFIYVPKSCEAADAACRLHVAFHGCKQSDQVLPANEKFTELTGYNRWADTNKLVILYPQARSISLTDDILVTEINPEGCWNWWGYANDDAYLYKAGDQISAVKAMVDRLQGH